MVFRINPRHPFHQFRDEMDRLLSGFVGRAGEGVWPFAGRGRPAANVWEDGDTLMIPETPGVVHVVGEVFNATSLLYEEGRTVGQYLRKVGGMTKEADEKQVSVIKADGSVISRQQSNRGKLVFWDSASHSWLFGGFMSLEMEPGDTIVVPRKLDRFLWIRTTKDLTQIVFQIAVAAGIAFAI